MKKRSQKLSLHRETLGRLESLPKTKLDRAAGGGYTSCIGPDCACLEDAVSVGLC